MGGFNVKKGKKGKSWKKKVIIVVVVIIVLGIIFSNNDGDEEDEPVAAYVADESNEVTDEEEANEEEGSPEGVYGLGDTFEFGGSSGLVELTFGTDITFTTIENQFSDLNGEYVIVLPVTMTNIDDETGSLNMFDISLFGSNGVSLDSVDLYFMDDNILWGSDLRSGATLDSYLHILYDGDGEYVIEFAAGLGFGDSAELVFQIQR